MFLVLMLALVTVVLLAIGLPVAHVLMLLAFVGVLAILALIADHEELF